MSEPNHGGKRSANRLKFTDAKLRKLEPSSKRTTYSDTECRGLKIRVSPSGVKSFVLEVNVPGRGMVKETLGRLDDVSVEEARELADAKRPQLKKGVPTAQEERREEKQRLEKAGGLDPKLATIQQVLDQYIAYKTSPVRERPMRPATEKFYRQVLAAVIPDRMNAPLLDIDVGAALKIITSYNKQELEFKNSSRNRRTSTAKGCLKALRALYGYWLEVHERELGDIRNPIANRQLEEFLKPAPPRRGRLLDEQLPAWWNAVTALPRSAKAAGAQYEVARDLLQFILLTGVRKDTARLLQWEAVDLAKRTFVIDADQSKNWQRIELPLCDHLVKLLGRRQVLQDDYVFASSATGKPIDLRWALRTVEKQTGLHTMVHDLRRTYAGVLERMDVGETAKKRLLGHSLGDITDVYSDTGGVTEPMRHGATLATNHILRTVGELDNVQKLEVVA